MAAAQTERPPIWVPVPVPVPVLERLLVSVLIRESLRWPMWSCGRFSFRNRLTVTEVEIDERVFVVVSLSV
jgi:hypothetical protein